MSAPKTITRGPGCLGDHALIDEAIRHGFELSTAERKWHNWEGGFCDSYDLGLSRAATRAGKYLQGQGAIIVDED